MGSKRWRRNRRMKCMCIGYHFPHRKGGGACDSSPTQAIHIAKRGGNPAEIAQAIADHAWQARGKLYTNPAAVCPF